MPYRSSMLDEEQIRQDERRRCAELCKQREWESNEMWKAAVLAGDLDQARRLDGEAWALGVAANLVRHRHEFEARTEIAATR